MLTKGAKIQCLYQRESVIEGWETNSVRKYSVECLKTFPETSCCPYYRGASKARVDCNGTGKCGGNVTNFVRTESSVTPVISFLQTFVSANSERITMLSLWLSSSCLLDILVISFSSRSSSAFLASSSLASFVASARCSIESFNCFSKSRLACCR